MQSFCGALRLPPGVNDWVYYCGSDNIRWVVCEHTATAVCDLRSDR